VKNIFRLVGICSLMAAPALLAAQTSESSRYTLNHAEVGIYGDYFRFNPGGSATNFVGLGARAGFNVSPNVAIEGQMSYDFDRNYTSTTKNGATTTFTRSSVRPITGLFGPKFQFGTSSPFRVFLTGKAGFVNFTTNNSGTASGSTFSSGVTSIGNGGNFLAVYPGGGFEGFFGPIGIRVEAGDEIYFNNGANNNLRLEFGPTFRF
jgi:hypothetical protein